LRLTARTAGRWRKIVKRVTRETGCFEWALAPERV
jgi:hypothetical protein